MASIPAARSLEDFLTKPVVAMDHRSTAAMRSGRRLSTGSILSDHAFAIKSRKRTLESSATIEEIINERSFWHGYTSEEEVASPADTDNMSFHSYSTDDPAASQVSIPEQLVQSCEPVEHECRKAQAVKLVPAGKAKVISLPKLVINTNGSRVERTPTNSPVQPPACRWDQAEAGSQTSSRNSRPNSPRSSSELSPVSTAPSSPQQPVQRLNPEKPPCRPPSQPVFEAAEYAMLYTPSPSRVLRPPHFASVIQHEQCDSSDRAPISIASTTPLPPSHGKLSKLTSTFQLGRIRNGLGRKDPSETNSGPRIDLVKEPEWMSFSTTAPPVQVPHQNSSVKPKMVARGANEREPPLVLPPCPDDYESDHDFSLASHFPLRKDSAMTTETTGLPQRKRSKLHKRRRRPSVSAALVSTQA